MSEIKNLIAEMKDIHDSDDAWHGPSLKKILSGVTSKQGAAQSVPSYRSIWEIVLHIAAWEDVFRERLEGKDIREPAQGDWPPVNSTGDAEWSEAIAYLDRAHEQLIRSVSKLQDSDLERIVAGKPYTISWMLHGVIRHHVYHAGQIALLKRL